MAYLLGAVARTLLNGWPWWRHSRAARKWDDLKAAAVLAKAVDDDAHRQLRDWLDSNTVFLYSYTPG